MANRRAVSLWMENDDEHVGAIVGYLWAPLAVSLAAFAVSFAIDLHWPGGHFTARSGAIIVLCGAVSTYGGAVRLWIERVKGFKSGVHDVPYGKVGVFLVVVGTVLWAYGDLWL